MKIRNVALILMLIFAVNQSIGACEAWNIIVNKASKNVVTASDKVKRKRITFTNGFTKIENRSFVNIIFAQGDAKIEVTGAENLVDYIKVRIKDGALIIEVLDDVSVRGLTMRNTPVVYVQAPVIEKISLYASGDCIVNGDLNVSNIEISTYASGNIRIEGLQSTGNVLIATYASGDFLIKSIRSRNCKFRTNASGDIFCEEVESETFASYLYASGDVTIERLKAAVITIDQKASGDFKATAIEGGDVAVSIYGSGDATLKGVARKFKAASYGSGDISARSLSTKEAEVESYGSGDVTYRAERVVSQSANGSGNVKRY